MRRQSKAKKTSYLVKFRMTLFSSCLEHLKERKKHERERERDRLKVSFKILVWRGPKLVQKTRLGFA